MKRKAKEYSPKCKSDAVIAAGNGRILRKADPAKVWYRSEHLICFAQKNAAAYEMRQRKAAFCGQMAGSVRRTRQAQDAAD